MASLHLLIGNKNYSSWSLRPWLLMKEAGIPFEEQLLPFGSPGWKEQVRKVNPAGQVPALVHEDGGERVVVWESLAICDYIARLHPQARLWPEGRAALAYGLAISSEMHAGFRDLRNEMPMNVRKSLPDRGRTPESLADIARVQRIWSEARSSFAADGPFLLGRFSVADAMYAPVVFRLNTYAVELQPDCAAYRDHMLALAPMRAWAEASVVEPWIVTHDEVE